MAVSVFIARRIDAGLFANIHDDLFAMAPDPHLLHRFLAAEHLHVAVAVERDLLVGLCAGVVHFGPDRPDALWIDRLRVAAPWRRQGVGTRLVMTVTDHARRLGCHDIWTLAGDGTDDGADDAGPAGFWRHLRWTEGHGRLLRFSTTP